MPTQPVDCEFIELPEDKRIGSFANAFRVVSDVGSEFLLDFLIFSQAEKTAVVVARIRVHSNMLPAIRDRLGAVLTELESQSQVGTPVPVFPQNPMFTAKLSDEVN